MVCAKFKIDHVSGMPGTKSVIALWYIGDLGVYNIYPLNCYVA